jgi:two-component sensor histidine kinase
MGPGGSAGHFMSLLDTLHRIRERPWLSHSLAFAILLVALGFRLTFDPVLQGLPFITFFPAIVIAGLLGGVQLGVAVTVMSALFAWYWLLPPGASFELNWTVVITLGLFALSSAVLLYIVHALDQAIGTTEQERDRASILLKELQHRTANNLSFLSSLVHLQQSASSKNPDAARALESMSQRVDTMVRIHRSLYGTAAQVSPLRDHVEKLCNDVLEATDARNIACTVDVAPARFDLNRLGLLSRLVAELVTNSVKHAFARHDSGTIDVRLTRVEDRYLLTVQDDGDGLPDNFESARHGLGVAIVKGLAGQLGGSADWINGAGTTAQIDFPVEQSVRTKLPQFSIGRTGPLPGHVGSRIRDRIVATGSTPTSLAKH